MSLNAVSSRFSCSSLPKILFRLLFSMLSMILKQVIRTTDARWQKIMLAIPSG